MNILIVESDPALTQIWQRHLERLGATVWSAAHTETAAEVLRSQSIDVIVLDLDIDSGSAFAIADYACYRSPEVRIVFVTRRSFFSDGSLFRLVPATAAFVPAEMRPDDLAAIVHHYAGQR